MVASMDYRLAPEHRWPAQLEDVLGAIAFLRSQLTDPERIALWGHSSGGHLAMMAALTKPEWIRSVVAVGAPSDLRSMADPTLSEVFDDIDQASPITIECADAPPMLLVHGTADRVCPVGQARAHRDARPDIIELLEVPDGDHGVRWPPIAALKARRQAVQWMVDQMDMPQRGSKWKPRKKKNR